MSQHLSTALKLLPPLPEFVAPAPMGLRYLRRGVYRSADHRFVVVSTPKHLSFGRQRHEWVAYAIEIECLSLQANTLQDMRILLGRIRTIPLMCACCGQPQIWQRWRREVEITCGCRTEAIVSWDAQKARVSRLTCGTMRCHHCGLEIPFSHRYFGQDAAGHLWAYHVNAMSQDDIGPDRCLKPEFWQAHFGRQGHGLMLEYRLTMTRNLEGGGEGTIVL